MAPQNPSHLLLGPRWHVSRHRAFEGVHVCVCSIFVTLIAERTNASLDLRKALNVALKVGLTPPKLVVFPFLQNHQNRGTNSKADTPKEASVTPPESCPSVVGGQSLWWFFGWTLGEVMAGLLHAQKTALSGGSGLVREQMSWLFLRQPPTSK